MTALLKVHSIETLYFDRIYALFGVSLEIEEGEIFTVLGPNGAGKTTLLRTIAGLLKDQPKKGEILFRGRRIDGWQPEAVARLGIVYVPEDRGLFKELTVAENLELGLWGRHDGGVTKDLDFVYGMFPILRERADQEAETLWASPRGSRRASTKPSPRSAGRGRPFCSWSRTPGSPSGSRAGARSWKPGAWCSRAPRRS